MTENQTTPPSGPTGFQNFQPRGGLITLPNHDGSHQYTLPPVDYETGIELRLYQERAAENAQVERENLEAMQAVQRQNREAAEQAKKDKKKFPDPEPLPEPKPVPHQMGQDEGPTPERMLGPVLEEMRANNEPEQMIDQASVVAWMEFLHGREVAEAFWNSGGDLKAVYDLLVRVGQVENFLSTSTGGANTTKPRASTSGTKSQPKRKPKSTTTTKNTPKSKAKSASPTKKS